MPAQSRRPWALALLVPAAGSLALAVSEGSSPIVVLAAGASTLVLAFAGARSYLRRHEAPINVRAPIDVAGVPVVAEAIAPMVDVGVDRAPLDDMFVGLSHSFRQAQRGADPAGVSITPGTLEIDSDGRTTGVSWRVTLSPADGDTKVNAALVSIVSVRDPTLHGSAVDLDLTAPVSPGQGAPLAGGETFAAFRRDIESLPRGAGPGSAKANASTVIDVEASEPVPARPRAPERKSALALPIGK